jgi:hypothetical protein
MTLQKKFQADDDQRKIKNFGYLQLPSHLNMQSQAENIFWKS